MVRRREYHYYRRAVRWLGVLVVALFVLLLPREAHAGYTHYWKWHVDPDRAKVERAIAEMSRIVDAKRDILEIEDAGADLAFNGIGAAGHETFVFPVAEKTEELVFVKTAYKPYDVVVTACLIVARDHFSRAELDILSDGDWAESWRPGAELYTKVLGRPAANPLSEDLAGAADTHLDPPEAEAPPPAENGRLRAIGITAAVIVALVIIRVLMAGRA